jgi:hypothetical protein
MAEKGMATDSFLSAADLALLLERDPTAWIERAVGQLDCRLDGLTLDVWMADWLSALDQRREQIIRWRFGLDGERLKLKEVGARLDLTRERVRQLQVRALEQLAQPRYRESMAPLSVLLHQQLSGAGGLISAAELDSVWRRCLDVGQINPAGVVRLICKLDAGFKWLRKTRAAGLTYYPLDQVSKIQKRFRRLLKQYQQPMSIYEFLLQFRSKKFYQKRRDWLSEAFMIACLRVSPGLELKAGMYVLRQGSGKRLEEIIQALRGLGQPAHFSAIAERANDLLPPDQRTAVQNIYAQMQRTPGIFVRVGHGIFGLKEWDLPADGSLANAAYRVLMEVGRPLHIEELTDRVLETWHVKPASVYQAVINDERFYRVGRATFDLVEMREMRRQGR